MVKAKSCLGKVYFHIGLSIDGVAAKITLYSMQSEHITLCWLHSKNSRLHFEDVILFALLRHSLHCYVLGYD